MSYFSVSEISDFIYTISQQCAWGALDWYSWECAKLFGLLLIFISVLKKINNNFRFYIRLWRNLSGVKFPFSNSTPCIIALYLLAKVRVLKNRPHNSAAHRSWTFGSRALPRAHFSPTSDPVFAATFPERLIATWLWFTIRCERVRRTHSPFLPPHT